MSVTLLTLLGIVLVCALAILIYIKIAPQFGASPTKERLENITSSPNYKNKVFQNIVTTNMDMGGKEMLFSLYQFLFKNEGRTPATPLPVKFNNILTENGTTTYITWYGHSALLLEIDGKRILIDPMLGRASAPVNFISKRFAYQHPIPISSITKIDAIVISHDHYDHLDYSSIIALKNHVAHFYTALGVGSHLVRWGVRAEQITELDWWQSSQLGNITLTATPARHFSGRGLTDRNKTQWASWVIKGTRDNIYFSGDSGYASHFKEIGERMGPFDFAFVECGQYNKLWESVHMMPEQSVQAAIDLNTAIMMPIHWGGFKLAMHSWTDPIERVTREADNRNLKICTPFIGERFGLGSTPNEKWWEGVK